jgi:hypothetical protein
MNATLILAIATTVAAALTVVISVLSLRTARAAERMARDADRHERMPVLICPASNGTTTVCNAGKGLALNIVIARAEEKLASYDATDVTFDELAQASWSNPAHLRPIEPGETVKHEWTGQPIMGLSYTDALGFPYTTVASRYGTKVFDGNAIKTLKLSELDYPSLVQ